MRLERTRRRIRVFRDALTALAGMYRRDRDLGVLIRKGLAITRAEGLGGVKSRVLRLAGFEIVVPVVPPPPLTYAEWLAAFDPSDADLDAARAHAGRLALPPVLILQVLDPAALPALPALLVAWQASIHPAWTAALLLPPGLSAPDLATIRASTAGAPVLLPDTPDEIARLRAGFTHSLLCRGHVLLNPLCLYMLLEASLRVSTSVAYADSDRVDVAGIRSDPSFRPQFSPGYLAHTNYIGDCVLLARDVQLDAADVAGLASSGVMAFDRLVSRLVRGRRVTHVPFVLSHVGHDVARAPHDAAPADDTGPTVAIVIPTRDGLRHLRPCLESILTRTSYDMAKVEVAIIDNNSVDPEMLAYLVEVAALDRIKVIPYPHPFNFAELNNVGARATSSDILVFLNDDTLVLDPAWLGKLVGQAKQPDVGVVGAKLLFPDGTIQHGGCVAGVKLGAVQHLLLDADADEVAASDHTRELSTVTGACCAIRRAVFDEVGGFDPVLRITWNDVKLCLDSAAAGYRTVYVADPLLCHDESRTRARDNTKTHMDRYFAEANYTRRRHRGVFQDDPFYSPNRSVEDTGLLAEPPRVRRPWSRPAGRPPRVLVLSSVYKFGFGVPVVIGQQVETFLGKGYEVVIGGQTHPLDVAFPGCERVLLTSAKQAAVWAFRHDVSLVIAHTPPFFEVPIFIGPHIPVLSYDYGEPLAEFFGEPVRSFLLRAEYQKRAAAPLTTTLAAISQAVKDEAMNADAVVVGLANSHLPGWSEALRPRRADVRAALGWDGRFVVLTVCRFGENERAYKGLDKIAQILAQYPFQHPEHGTGLIWALAGGGLPEDVLEAEALGFTVFPNVPQERLIDLYTAADAYMGFSRWEGYNLGISQALAMGLPVIASDIPAHREFPIVTTNSTLAVCDWLADQVAARAADRTDRTAVVFDWQANTTRFGQIVAGMLAAGEATPPRLGASPRGA